MDGSPRDATERAVSAADEHLDGWKEIADYFRRDVRTVQRWEKEERLPVHRHGHSRRARPYAYTSELAAWRATRDAQPQTDVASQRRSAARGWLTLMLVGSGMLFVAVGYWWGSKRTVTLTDVQQRRLLLVGTFENRTGDPTFDDSIEFALTTDLSQSEWLAVVPRQRVEDMLRLMQQPAGTAITAANAREICLRDGEIPLFVTGRMDRAGEVVVLAAQVVDVGTGMVIARSTEEARTTGEVLSAVQRLSGDLRRALGDRSPSRSTDDAPLEKVMTKSLPALQLYSKADRLMKVSQTSDAVAMELLQRATALDPTFASAYILLAWTVHNIGRSADEYLPLARRALELSESVTDSERLFIRASYFEMSARPDAAIAPLRALMEIQPDHYWAVNNLTVDLLTEDRIAEAAEYAARSADARPHDLSTNAHAAWLLGYLGQERDAARYLDRARRLVDHVRQDPVANTWVELIPAWNSWMAGNVREALQRVDALRSQPMDDAEGDRAELLGYWYIVLGRLSDAAQMFERLPSGPQSGQDDDLALVAFAREDDNQARIHIQSLVNNGSDGTLSGMLTARYGSPNDVARIHQRIISTKRTSAVDGEVARVQHNPLTAIPLLERAAKEPIYGFSFFARESLAAALDETGDRAAAIRALEIATKQRPRVCALEGGPLSAYFWLRTQVRLADLYRDAGRIDAAQRVEALIQQLLGVADRDHPMLAHLKARPQNTTGTRGSDDSLRVLTDGPAQ